MKTLAQLREDIQSKKDREIKRIKNALEDERLVQEANVIEAVQSVEFDAEDPDNRRDPPPVVVMRRKAIRTFPNGKKVALYFAASIDKYLSVPYDTKGSSNKEDKNVAV